MSEMRENGRFQNISTNMHAVKRLTVNYDAPRIVKLQPDRFLIFILIRRHVTFKLRVFHKQILPFMRSRPAVPYGACLYMMWLNVKVPFTAANQIQVHHEWSLKWFYELSDLCISRGCQLVILLMSVFCSQTVFIVFINSVICYAVAFLSVTTLFCGIVFWSQFIVFNYSMSRLQLLNSSLWNLYENTPGPTANFMGLPKVLEVGHLDCP